MNEALLTTVGGLLAQSNVKNALDLMRTWLATAAPGEPELLLAECQPELKPKIALLMRDLLSRYPHTIIGAPTLFYFKSDEEGGVLGLPSPTIDSAYPCHDLQFLGWAPLSTKLPLQLPFRNVRGSVRISSCRIEAAVAVFKSHPNIFDHEELILPDSWWAYLFQERDGNSVRISARVLLPYPDALESARAMLAAAYEGQSQTDFQLSSHFIGASGLEWAHAAGQLFKETCQHLAS